MHQTLSRSFDRAAVTPAPPRTRRELDTWEIVGLFDRLDPAERAHVLRVTERLAEWHGRKPLPPHQ